MKKRINVALLVLIIGIVALIFFNIPYIYFVEGNKKIEKGSVFYPEEFINKSRGTVTFDNESIDTSEVGSGVINFTVENWLMKRNISYYYEIVDTTPPEIIVREKLIKKRPYESYGYDDVSKNIILNEGTFEYESDYDPDFSGTYTVDIIASDEYGNSSRDYYKVEVIDDEPPFVLWDGNGTRIVKGNDFDIMDYISYGDNADPEPELVVEGEVNTNKTGYYLLHASLTDSSGNETKWNLGVRVVSKIPEEEREEEEYLFADFVKDYQGEGRKFGLDVSEWQDDIDFDLIRKSGCEFIIIRAGFSYEGVFTVDKKFKANLEKAKKAQIPVGIYLFCYDNNEEDLVASLDQMFAELGDEELELPIVFDWEDFGCFPEYKMSFQMLKHLYDVFEKYVSDKGHESMLYGSQYYLRTIWQDTNAEKVWLAQYIDWPTYQGSFDIWQASDSGKIEGIEWPVDLNVMFIDLY